MKEHIPDQSVRRLSAYLRQLEQLGTAGVERVSSQQLAEYMRVGAAQVRRDLALFGQFGRPGLGYQVKDLIRRLRIIMGTDKRWNAVIVGVGSLARALMRYPGLPARGFDIVAAFDIAPNKIGTQIGRLQIQHMNALAAVIREQGVRLAILTVPADAAQDVADRLVRAGIEGIMNFATQRLDIAPGVHVSHVDLTAHLEELSFWVTNARPDRGVSEAPGESG